MPHLEEWKPVVGYEDLYEVSDLGRVRSWVNNASRRRDCPKILSPNYVKGYLRVSLSKNNVVSRFFIHVLVLNAFVGPQPVGNFASHLDGISYNNKLSNLCWETSSANNLRKKSHGTRQEGELHGLAKLTNDAVANIRALHAEGLYSMRELGRLYKVCHGTISRVIHRRIWTHI